MPTKKNSLLFLTSPVHIMEHHYTDLRNKIDTSRPQLNPERHLWLSVIYQALKDVTYYTPQFGRNINYPYRIPFVVYRIDKLNADRARAWFVKAGTEFTEVCDLAGVCHLRVREIALKIINNFDTWVTVPEAQTVYSSKKITACYSVAIPPKKKTTRSVVA